MFKKELWFVKVSMITSVLVHNHHVFTVPIEYQQLKFDMTKIHSLYFECYKFLLIGYCHKK